MRATLYEMSFRMISEEEFRKRWNEAEDEEELLALGVDSQYVDLLPDDVALFLTESGLPEDAAPFLSFDLKRGGLKRIYEVFGQPDDYVESEKQRLRRYLVIGSDGAGNPIAIDLQDDCSVIQISHDDGFNAVWFMNSSVFQLAESLLEVRDMIFSFIDSDLSRTEDDEIPMKYKQPLLGKLKMIDSRAHELGTFWESQIGML